MTLETGHIWDNHVKLADMKMPLVRRHPFKNSTVLKIELLEGRVIATRTIRNWLKVAGYRARRPIRRPTMTRNHHAARIQWSIQRWNLAS